MNALYYINFNFVAIRIIGSTPQLLEKSNIFFANLVNLKMPLKVFFFLSYFKIPFTSESFNQFGNFVNLGYLFD